MKWKVNSLKLFGNVFNWWWLILHWDWLFFIVMVIDYAVQIANDWFWLSRIGRSISRLHGSRKGSVNIGVCLGNGRDIGVWLYLPILPIRSPVFSILVSTVWMVFGYIYLVYLFCHQYCQNFQYISVNRGNRWDIGVWLYYFYSAYLVKNNANIVNICVNHGNRWDVGVWLYSVI